MQQISRARRGASICCKNRQTNNVNKTSCRFLLSVADPSGLPEGDWPRIAITGRSNVGKSSLLNCLVGEAAARTSRTPGRTQLVNCFLAGEQWLLLDLPGYGYARAPEATRKAWGRLAEGAILAGGGVDLALVLLDARHDPSDLDRMMMEWLSAEGIRWIPVATKWDKLSMAERSAALQWLRTMTAERGCGAFVATSASTGFGIPELWKEIHAADGQRHSDHPGARGDRAGA